MNPRKMRKKLKHVDFKSMEWFASSVYKRGGEYKAMLWLKAYSENKAASEPSILIRSMLRSIIRGDKDPKFKALFAETLMDYCQ